MTDSNATELTSITVEGTAATIDGAYDDDFVTFFLYFKIIYEIQNNIFRQNRKCHQRSIFAAIQDEKYAITEVHWVKQIDQMAVCCYVFEWSGLINGQPAHGAGRGTSVIVKEGEEWLLLSEHLGAKQ